MKKISIIALVLGIVTSSANAIGADTPKMTETVNTVGQVKKMPDNSSVIVVGRITNSMGNGMYLFEDKTDTIMVNISDTAWRGKTVTSNENVKLHGQTDVLSDRTTIDVNYVEKM